ncbi:MAG: YdcF family protein [Peptostreptococcus sp.]|uniref:YdcF family protein n=1 Tax=Peptostreptococcus sp. TaxID=1262 RepID=UPI002FC8377D
MDKLFSLIKTLILIFVCVMLILEAIIIYGGRNNYNEDADYIMVLGAKLHGDRPSKSLKYRMEAALEYMQKDPELILIATGGQGHDESIPEGQAIKKYFISKGIDESRILVEDKSENTFENMKMSREMIEKDGRIKVNIVSNKYHIFRAKMLAQRNNFDPYGVPAKTPESVLIKSYLREALALVKSYIFDR